jgi:dehydrogenase/reductase SDR family protein 7B
VRSFQNKVVWITGATSGIGEALAMEFANQGAKLILSARREAELQRVKTACSASPEVLVLPLDLGKQDEFTALTLKVVAHFGQLDLLINNGGISQRSEAAETSLDVDRQIMEINYFGQVALTKAVLPQLQKQQSGHIVTISSLSGKFGFFLRSAYAASKHALVGFFESLRLEERKNGIAVTLVFPGLISTNISTNALTGTGGKHGEKDNKQNTGMPADQCARIIVKGILKQKEEILVGKGEMKAVLIKRLFPKLFSKLIRKQKPT